MLMLSKLRINCPELGFGNELNLLSFNVELNIPAALLKLMHKLSIVPVNSII